MFVGTVVCGYEAELAHCPPVSQRSLPYHGSPVPSFMVHEGRAGLKSTTWLPAGRMTLIKEYMTVMADMNRLILETDSSLFR